MVSVAQRDVQGRCAIAKVSGFEGREKVRLQARGQWTH